MTIKELIARHEALVDDLRSTASHARAVAGILSPENRQKVLADADSLDEQAAQIVEKIERLRCIATNFEALGRPRR
ncbi:MAG: hypothetical protein ACHQ50_03645 [Fimbriimonadales bacterium]